jgi:hypothetical protein
MRDVPRRSAYDAYTDTVTSCTRIYIYICTCIAVVFDIVYKVQSNRKYMHPHDVAHRFNLFCVDTYYTHTHTHIYIYIYI